MTDKDKEILNDLNSMAQRGALTGVFTDIPIEVYHSCAGVSSSNLKPIIARAKGFEYSVPDSSEALIFGNAFHTYLLEPKQFKERYVISIVPKDGKIPISPTAMNLIYQMADAFRACPEASDLFADSVKELTFFSIDPVTGILQKARADIFQQKESIKISDIKTCLSANQWDFARACKKYLYRVSASYYLKVISEASNQYLREFYLLACPKDTTQRVKAYQVDHRSLSEGDMEVRLALDIIARIQIEGEAKVWNEIESGIKEISI